MTYLNLLLAIKHEYITKVLPQLTPGITLNDLNKNPHFTFFLCVLVNRIIGCNNAPHRYKQWIIREGKRINGKHYNYDRDAWYFKETSLTDSIKERYCLLNKEIKRVIKMESKCI